MEVLNSVLTMAGMVGYREGWTGPGWGPGLGGARAGLGLGRAWAGLGRLGPAAGAGAGRRTGSAEVRAQINQSITHETSDREKRLTRETSSSRVTANRSYADSVGGG